MSILFDLYRSQQHQCALQEDKDQEKVLKVLETLHVHLLTPKTWWSSSKTVKGVYIWGPVGRGKTYLMDLFINCLDGFPYKRYHFHLFMQNIHHRLEQLRTEGSASPLRDLAKKISEDTRLLCLDECLVTTIGDAMILSGLFNALFKRGIVLVVTSNNHPQKLYDKGLNRHLFLPFLEILAQHVEVISLTGTKDYRLLSLRQAQPSFYFFPLTAETDKKLWDIWNTITPFTVPQPLTLKVKGRLLILPRTSPHIAWVTFEEMCQQPLGNADYDEILKTFPKIIFSDIPLLTLVSLDAVQRFMNFIDLAYERKNYCFFSAEAPLEKLYPHPDLPFERTYSRLMEMSCAEGYQ